MASTAYQSIGLKTAIRSAIPSQGVVTLADTSGAIIPVKLPATSMTTRVAIE